MKKIKTIGLVLPAGAIKDKKEIEEKILILKNNYKIKEFYNQNHSCNYLSDTPENRINFLEQAFLDKETDLILAIRGGFGSIEIVDNINYELIKDTDKYFVGSSDITILLTSLFKKTNIKCFFGLMVGNGFVENLEKNIESIEKNCFNLNITPYKNYKKTKGILWGGNLSSLVSMFSAEQFVPNEDIILFLEDLNEPLYKIDKMMFEIYRNKVLKEKIKGIIFGDFYLKNNEIYPLFDKYSNLFNCSTFICKEITHKTHCAIIPFGKEIIL